MSQRREHAAAFVRSSVKIPSATPGWNLDAWLYQPASAPDTPRPVIVMANGVGCTKRMGLAAFAEPFAAAGYACVVFDYRRWGESDGDRRNSLIIGEQLEDYRTVVRHCRAQSAFDRVVLWGFSFAGGHATTLAAEPALRAAAAIAQSPYAGRPFPFQWNLRYFRMLFRGVADLAAGALGAPPVYIPTAGRPGADAMCTAPGFLPGVTKVTAQPEDFRNQISASAFVRVPLYSPRATAAKITCPVLFVAPARDGTCPAASTKAMAALVPRGEVIEVEGDHFDMFPGEVDYKATLAAELAFLRKHVPL